MLKRVSRVLLLMALPILLSACAVFKRQLIDSYLNKTEDLPALQVNFKEPPPPYVKTGHKVLDGLWQNREKSSSISYFSSCSQVPRSLQAFQASSYPSDLNYKVLRRVKKKDFFYSELIILKREPAKQEKNSKDKAGGSRVGRSGGKKTQPQTFIAVYTMREKDCLFNLNFVAPSQKIFKEDSALFQNFIQNFKSL